MNEQTKVVLEYEARDPKKHAVRWDQNETDTLCNTVYLRKDVAPAFDRARKVRMTLEVVE